MARILFPILALLFTCVYSLPSVGEVFSQLARRAAPPTWSTILRNVPWNVVQVSIWGRVPGTLDQPVQFLNTEGDGVRVYVLDSGIFKGHEVFGGTNVFDFKNRTNTPYCGGGQEDQDDNMSHGTCIAGIIRTVAPKVTIVNVKIDCIEFQPASNANAIGEAIEKIIAEHKSFQSGTNTPPGWRGSIINFSSSSFALNPPVNFQNAVKNAIAAGIPFIASDGNLGGVQPNAPYPCREQGVLCVSASTDQYKLQSNFATALYPEISYVAPGNRIKCAGIGDPDARATKSGSSFAVPHVVGVASYFIGFEGINNNASNVASRLSVNSQQFQFGTNAGGFITARMPNTGLQSPARNLIYPYAGYDPVVSGQTIWNVLGTTIQIPDIFQLFLDIFGPAPFEPETPQELYIVGGAPS